MTGKGSDGDAAHSSGHIIQSLLVNVAIAVVKAGAAVLTRSGAMLAEAIHSAADCGNQLLLLIGVRQSRRPPSDRHPLGHGRDLYFWSFLVALMLFTGGGVFSIYEGIHKLLEPEAVHNVGVGLGVLVLSLLLEGGATLSNVRELNKRRGTKPFVRYLQDTTDSDLVVVFGENAAAVLGLLLALGSLTLSATTGDGRWDGAGSLLIGLVLVAVAGFLAVEIKSLLVGEAADAVVREVAEEQARKTAHVDRVLHLMALQQGPGEVVLVIKLAFTPGLSIEAVCGSINDFEARVRALRPEIRWIFVEPDLPRS